MGAVGTTSAVESAGSKDSVGADGALASPGVVGDDCFEQAAKAPGAITPTASAAKACRRDTAGMEGTASAGFTWTQRT
ncbi:hypothetical protein MMOR_58130 [Mycolicibacterium moriokaense]|uniref:Uncharacterized protein n=1 Tax=Mycolicibacterium moriokaense TaxID=39691 RepID=A0AAD1M8F2_9MYCO|nr:hypothetical protein MMOR_58130 [Mycolicibacterium moriokaense]